MKNFAISKKGVFPVLIGVMLLLGLTSTVFLSQQSQDRRSRAQTASSSLWDSTVTPAVVQHTEAKAVTLGVKFKPLTDGVITGIKFYKGATNTGTHSATLWTSTGQLLANATFENETDSGWQQVNFSSPVSVTANTTYVASYFAPQGHFSYTIDYFKTQYTNGGLIALANGEEGGNGVYKYSSGHEFPTSSYKSTNYWVDVIFEATSAPPSCNTNSICQENQKPGNPASEWDITAEDVTLQGYAANLSVNKGETVEFKVNTPATDYRFDIYRIGYYGGMGARKIATVEPSATLPQTQPACINDTSIGLVDCGNWAVSGSWHIPADAVSGVYIAKIVREDGSPGANHIYFVVRDDEGHSDLLVQTSDTTWQAYNTYGGSSLYKDSTGTLADKRAYKVSYNRPILTRFQTNLGVPNAFFNAEYPMIRWLEANGYNVSYTSGLDTAMRASEILEHKIFLSVGHDEYWSNEMRNAVENARNNGVSLGWFSGNTMFWKTRWENSIDGANTPYKTMVSYKETHANAKIDPSAEWTGTWRDPRFSPPADGGRPENAVMGTIFTINGMRNNDVMTVPADYAKMRLWRNTSIANLQPGGIASFPAGILGFEWEEDLDNGFRPAGLIHMSSTTIPITTNQYLIPSLYGSSYSTGVGTHHLTLYKHPSGALVFGSGMVQWSWGLDATHDRAGTPTDIRIQQATVNLFADMGAQPKTIQPGLVPAAKSTDMNPPTTTIGTPSNGGTVTSGTDVLIQGTASDAEGIVGSVEVSTDGGITWKRATGRENWTYTWKPSTLGPVTIKVRATDDSGNTQGVTTLKPQTVAATNASTSTSSDTTTSINVTVVERICPCTIWDPNQTPTVASHNDTKAVELGVKFRTSKNGYITGIRFYKGSLNTGTHIGSLWTNTGTRLAQATFTNETTDGWQQVNFSSPVPVTANTTYVASYFAPNGGYSWNDYYFTQANVSSPLTALADGTDGANSLEKYSTTSTFPTGTYHSSNYWVDVVFITEKPESVWSDETTPATAAYPDTRAVNLGLQFQPTVDGYITGIKFYKGSTNTGTHVGSLWNSTGQLLTQTTFSNETSSGWQKVNFATPVPVTANTTYTVSLFAPNGGFSLNTYYFTQAMLSGNLFAPANAGVYKYSSSMKFPNQVYKSSNYWVDVLFKPNN